MLLWYYSYLLSMHFHLKTIDYTVRRYHVKEHIKMCQTQVSKVTLHFVWGQLSRKQTVTRFAESVSKKA